MYAPAQNGLKAGKDRPSSSSSSVMIQESVPSMSVALVSAHTSCEPARCTCSPGCPPGIICRKYAQQDHAQSPHISAFSFHEHIVIHRITKPFTLCIPTISPRHCSTDHSHRRLACYGFSSARKIPPFGTFCETRASVSSCQVLPYLMWRRRWVRKIQLVVRGRDLPVVIS